MHNNYRRVSYVRHTLTCYENFCCSILVVGDGRGHILFFDKNVKILFWIRNLSIGYITDIGFSITPKLYQFQNSKILLRGNDPLINF